MTNKRNGFTLIEATITVAVASILATIAVPQYNIYVAKTQLAESIVLMDSVKPTTVASVVKNGLCTIDGKNLVVDGKYGSLVVSGTVNQTAVKNSKVRMATGCVFTYTANTTGVSKLIAGKTVVADLFNNGTFSKNPATTADPKFVPKALSLLDQDTAGGKLTPVVPGGPDITNPDDNGGPSTPITPPDPTNPIDPTNPPDPTNPTDPTKPPDPTDPTDPISPEDPSGGKVDEINWTGSFYYMNYNAQLNNGGYYPVNYSGPLLFMSEYIDKRQPIVIKSDISLYVDVPKEAKYAVVKIQMDSHSATITLKEKRDYNGKLRFYTAGEINFDCGNVSKCNSTLDKNMNGGYFSAGEPLRNFFRKNLREIYWTPSLGGGFWDSAKKGSVNVKIYY